MNAETRLTSAILRAVNASGLAIVWRAQAGKVRTRGGFMQLGPAGLPDIVGVLRWRGTFLAYEVKLPGGKAKSHQDRVLAQIRACGAVARVVSSPEEAVAHLLGLGVADLPGAKP